MRHRLARRFDPPAQSPRVVRRQIVFVLKIIEPGRENVPRGRHWRGGGAGEAPWRQTVRRQCERGGWGATLGGPKPIRNRGMWTCVLIFARSKTVRSVEWKRVGMSPIFATCAFASLRTQASLTHLM